MKNILTLILLFTVTQAFTQRGTKEHRERLESRKIAFLSDRLDLSPQEAQIFWPVYNEFTDALENKRRSCRQIIGEEFETDDQANTILEKNIAFEQEQLEIKKKYIEKIKEIIGAQKTLILIKTERKFKEEILRSVNERRRARKEGNK